MHLRPVVHRDYLGPVVHEDYLGPVVHEDHIPDIEKGVPTQDSNKRL